MPSATSEQPALHTFQAAAFVENIALKELGGLYPDAALTPRVLTRPCASGGRIFVYPFGAVVFFDVGAEEREAELERLRRARPELGETVITEELAVRIEARSLPKVVDGVLNVDRMTLERAGIVALTIGQSAAMEYYERIVEELFAATGRLVERLEERGTVPFYTRPLHRFIGSAIATRNEALSVLHLLDRPEEAWEDPSIDRIYDELRDELDLADRHQALELKLRAIQESLELVLDVARDRRLVLLEVAIVVLIAFEIILTLVERAG
ncbi:MAG TPA: RMD1 family protein [Polyangiaceae bacterium]